MSLNAERSFAIEVVAQAADMLGNWSRGNIVPLEKAFGEMVTDADKMLNTFFVDAIARSFSHDAICAEEGSPVDDDHAERRWFVDPIDGTRSFVSGKHSYSIMLSLVVSGTPALAVIYDAGSEAIYCAARGRGISVRGWARRMPPSLLTPTSDLIWSPYADPEKGIDVRNQLQLEGIHHQESMGCRAIAMFHGRGVVFSSSSRQVKLWDIAAPEVFVNEMGGCFSDHRGERIEYMGNHGNIRMHGAIASRERDHAQVINTLARNDPFNTVYAEHAHPTPTSSKDRK